MPRYGSSAGPPAMIHREPGQARKGAATAVDSCAGMWLVELSPISFLSLFYFLADWLLVIGYCSDAPLLVWPASVQLIDNKRMCMPRTPVFQMRMVSG